MFWKIGRSLIIAIGLITETFMAFFIWDQHNDLKLVLYYSLILFASVPIGALVAGILAEDVLPKLSILLASWLIIIQILIMLFFKENLNEQNILFIGLLGGLSEGLMVVGVNIMDFENGVKDHAKFYASNIIVKEILTLVIPLGAAFLIHINSYDVVFKITAGIVLACAFFVTIFRSSYIPNKFEIKKILAIPGTNRDKKPLIWGTFLEGLSEGITLSILPIILLYMVGNILNWGLINTFLVVIAIILSIFLRNIVNDSNSKILFVIGAAIFALSSLLFLNNYSFTILMVFLIAKVIMDVIKEISYHSSLERIMEEDRMEYQLHGEYEFLIQLSTASGRVLPVLILIFLNIQITNEIMIRMFLLVVGILPIIIISALGKSAIFNSSYEKDRNINNINDLEPQFEENSDIPELNPVHITR
jgi:hypothetical protein